MTNFDAWDRAMTPFEPADFATEQEVREAVSSLRETNPDWNLTDEQEEQIVTHWQSEQE